MSAASPSTAAGSSLVDQILHRRRDVPGQSTAAKHPPRPPEPAWVGRRQRRTRSGKLWVLSRRAQTPSKYLGHGCTAARSSSAPAEPALEVETNDGGASATTGCGLCRRRRVESRSQPEGDEDPASGCAWRGVRAAAGVRIKAPHVTPNTARVNAVGIRVWEPERGGQEPWVVVAGDR